MERKIYLYADMVKIPTITLTQQDKAEIIRLSMWSKLTAYEDQKALCFSGEQNNLYQFLINLSLNGWHFTLF